MNAVLAGFLSGMVSIITINLIVRGSALAAVLSALLCAFTFLCALALAAADARAARRAGERGRLGSARC